MLVRVSRREKLETDLAVERERTFVLPPGKNKPYGDAPALHERVAIDPEEGIMKKCDAFHDRIIDEKQSNE